MKTTNSVLLRSGERVNLVTDDTFTLAWCGRRESTPAELAADVEPMSLLRLRSHPDSNISSKVRKALSLVQW